MIIWVPARASELDEGDSCPEPASQAEKQEARRGYLREQGLPFLALDPSYSVLSSACSVTYRAHTQCGKGRTSFRLNGLSVF